ncbi:unnamed protein product, partial [Mesorhabditis spiculigera]
MDLSKRNVVTPQQRKNGLYHIYEWKDKKVVEVSRFNPLDIFLVCLVPSLTGCISAIVIALLFHHEQISNYNWQCGVSATFTSANNLTAVSDKLSSATYQRKMYPC